MTHNTEMQGLILSFMEFILNVPPTLKRLYNYMETGTEIPGDGGGQ